MAIITMQVELFISHSSDDQRLAEALVDLLKAALSVPVEAIRCTSVDGCKLPTGAHTETQLRRELLEAPAFIGLVTPSSIRSAYVLFELGARWGAEKSVFPLLAAGADASLLRGPLSTINARKCYTHAEVHQFIADLASILRKTPSGAAGYQRHLEALLKAAKEPSTDSSVTISTTAAEISQPEATISRGPPPFLSPELLT